MQYCKVFFSNMDSDCQICFTENCDKKYTCFKCKKNICYQCLEMYINCTSDFLKCACTEYILPSSLKDLNNIYKYKQFMLKRIELNFYDDLLSIKNYMDITSNIRKKRHELMMEFPKCINLLINSCFSKELNSIHVKFNKLKNQIDFTKICHISICDGTIVENTCNKCSCKYCDTCLEIQNEEHVCKNEDILSKNFIKDMSISCPKCKLPIEKSSGCSYITCAACNTKFDHTTNEVTNYGGHSSLIQVKISKSEIFEEIKEKYPDIPKKVLDKIRILESLKLKHNTHMLKNLAKNKHEEAIKYYETYLQEQRKHKENIKILQRIRKFDKEQLVDFFK